MTVDPPQPGFSDTRVTGNPWWAAPTHENTNFRPPGHERMFGNGEGWNSDRPNRSFTARKKHGWWGREEYFDEDGRKIG